MGKKTKKSAERKCVLCGKILPFTASDCVVGATGQAVCRTCLGIAKRLPEVPVLTGRPAKVDLTGIKTPVQIMAILDKSIIGQTAAKRAVAVAMWKQQLRAVGDETVPPANLLLYGPSGCGKTAMVRTAAKAVGLPFLEFDATTLSETGYKGRDATEIIGDLVSRFKRDERMEYGVIFLDEIDKLAVRGSDSQQMYNRATQYTLLKLVEGTAVSCDGRTVDTGKLLFLFGGAFVGLQKQTPVWKPAGFRVSEEELEPVACRNIEVMDFLEFGMTQELMGRIGQWTPVTKLTEGELRQILLKSDLSAFRKYQAFFAAHGVKLKLTRPQADRMVRQAAARGIGARGLNALVEELVAPLLLRLAEGMLMGGVSLLGEEADDGRIW